MTGETILIAARTDLERKCLGYLLASKGLCVTEAGTAADAGRLARAERFGLVLLDVAFWRKSDVNVLVELKRSESTHSVPVVLLGRPANQEEITTSLMEGASNWVIPQRFEIDPFVAKVRDLLATAKPDVALATEDDGAGSGGSGLERLTKSLVGEVLTDLKHLPAFEFSITEAVTTTCGKDQVLEHVVELASRDPALALALLHQAGEQGDLQKAGTGLRQAVSAIEVAGFYQLVESLPSLAPSKITSWDAGYFWCHSVATARVAGLISQMLNLGNAAEVASAGLLHDLGDLVLAHGFPKQFKGLVKEARSMPSLQAGWERQLLGAHRGEIAAWTFAHLGMPETLQQVVRLRNAPPAVLQTMPASSRLTGLIVHAASQLTSALIPADPALATLSMMYPGFLEAVENSHQPATKIVDAARKVVAELVTEAAYLFPESASRRRFYADRPLDLLVYYEPTECALDSLKMALEVRCNELTDLNVGQALPDASCPIVLNLSYLPELSDHFQVLTNLEEVGVLAGRRGLVILPGEVDARHRSLVPKGWQLLNQPTHPHHWLKWLASKDKGDTGVPHQVRVA